MINEMKRVDALLAIYGLLFLMLGDVINKTSPGYSAIFLSAGEILTSLCVCRLLIERMR